MADALSIAGGIIAILQATDRLGGLLRQLREYWKAPDLINALINEVSDIRVVIGEEQVIAEDLGHGDPIVAGRLKAVLKDALDTIHEIDRIVEYNLTRPGGSNPTKPKRLAWLMHREKISRLHKDLRKARHLISDHLAVLLMCVLYQKLYIDEVALTASSLGENIPRYRSKWIELLLLRRT